jgi:hypothetical protein
MADGLPSFFSILHCSRTPVLQDQDAQGLRRRFIGLNIIDMLDVIREVAMQKSNRKFVLVVALAALAVFGSLAAGFAADPASAKAVFYVQ